MTDFNPPFDPAADFAAGHVTPAAAAQLRTWWAERGLESAALDTLLADPISAPSFTDRLLRAIRVGRALHHGA